MLKSNSATKKTPGRIYLDFAASADPNPSSIHEEGIDVRRKLEDARAKVARILGARSSEIIFTSGGTESNNLAIQGAVFAAPFKKPHIVTTNIEHPSVLEICSILKQRGLAAISVVQVGRSGVVDPREVKKAITDNTVVVSVQYANNEIGTIEPLREIAKEIRHFRRTNNSTYPLFHTDAVQAASYLDLNVEKLGVDLLSLSGSKIAGAGRVGILYKKSSVRIAPILGGGDQEWGLRPGTENVSAVLEFTDALGKTQKKKEKEIKRLTKLRDYFLNTLRRTYRNIIINSDAETKLPNLVSVTFPKIPSDLLVIELSARGIMSSSKSACKSSSAGGSYVISAIWPEANPEIGAVRFSFGSKTNKEEINQTIRALNQILEKLKIWYT